ncbi:acetylcholinesterase-like [Dermacentor andersoni]|uniref:acetylcholinesterase-like n=1 Tax=Dermacentor andersoni TaxID=34620 RepID=UPI002155E7BB|nr:cholinesterase 2-like [Dermacentor andersoni]
MTQATSVLVPMLFAGLLSAMPHDMHIERETTLGRVRGNLVRALGKAVEEYRGIPFAKPPVGNLRFRPPKPKVAWEGTLDATARFTACHQVTVPGITLDGATVTEDCLHLNVWVPQSTENVTSGRPVLVWIHGGGLTFGTANQAIYNGAVLAALTDMLVVSMNYRLGILGFMNANSPEAPGNVGYMDQNMALKWVHRNIGCFGGDRKRVTLFGESAGSTSTHAQILSPMSQGLFKRAVLLSGSMYSIDTWDTVKESMAKGDKVANAVGCSVGGRISMSSNPEEIVDCLRSMPADVLFNVSVKVVAPKFTPFSPTYHNEFFPRNPLVAVRRGFFSPVDVIAGVTSDEAAGLLLIPPKPELLVEDLNSSKTKGLTDSLREALWKFVKADLPVVLKKYTDEVPEGDKNALRRQYIDYISDRLFNCPLQFFAEKHSKRCNKVFAYVFAHRQSKYPLPRWMRAPHAFDLPFVFGHPYGEDPDSVDGRLSKAFIRMLASFSENGIPELPQRKKWPQYTSSSPTMMLIDKGHFNVTQGFRSRYCERWRSLY